MQSEVSTVSNGSVHTDDEPTISNPSSSLVTSRRLLFENIGAVKNTSTSSTNGISTVKYVNSKMRCTENVKFKKKDEVVAEDICSGEKSIFEPQVENGAKSQKVQPSQCEQEEIICLPKNEKFEPSEPLERRKDAKIEIETEIWEGDGTLVTKTYETGDRDHRSEQSEESLVPENSNSVTRIVRTSSSLQNLPESFVEIGTQDIDESLTSNGSVEPVTRENNCSEISSDDSEIIPMSVANNCSMNNPKELSDSDSMSRNSCEVLETSHTGAGLERDTYSNIEEQLSNCSSGLVLDICCSDGIESKMGDFFVTNKHSDNCNELSAYEENLVPILEDASPCSGEQSTMENDCSRISSEACSPESGTEIRYCSSDFVEQSKQNSSLKGYIDEQSQSIGDMQKPCTSEEDSETSQENPQGKETNVPIESLSSESLKDSELSYPEELNPFADGDESLESEIKPRSTNPFDSDPEEESTSVNISEPKKSTNPFWSGSEEESWEEETVNKKSSSSKYGSAQSLNVLQQSGLKASHNASSTPNLTKVSATSPLGNSTRGRKKKPAPLPPLQKVEEDYNTRLETLLEDIGQKSSGTERVSSNQCKTSVGTWRRKKGPAPPLPVAHRRYPKTLPVEDIKRELADIEIKQQELERQGVKLEQCIRDKGDEDPSAVEEMVLQLFEVVNEKNELFRKQTELMYLRKQQKLEQEYAELEYQIRCSMLRPERNKTDNDKVKEEELIKRLIEVVEKRNEVIEAMEKDRLREVAEDHSILTELGAEESSASPGTTPSAPPRKCVKKKEETPSNGKVKTKGNLTTSPKKVIKEKFATLKRTAKNLHFSR